jgi:hypothetical protein
MTKLANTSETAIAITFLVINLEALLKQLAFFGFNFNSFSWHFPSRQSKYYPLPLYPLLSA